MVYYFNKHKKLHSYVSSKKKRLHLICTVVKGEKKTTFFSQITLANHFGSDDS